MNTKKSTHVSVHELQAFLALCPLEVKALLVILPSIYDLRTRSSFMIKMPKVLHI